MLHVLIRFWYGLLVLNNLMEIHLIPLFASDFKSDLFSQVKFNYIQVYLTYI